MQLVEGNQEALQQRDWSRSSADMRPSQMRGRKKSKRMYQFPSTLQLHIDREDRRIKELTEGILYDFLPAALSIMVPEATEVKLECCQAVAGAALCIACLMNAPPGFLEFLCCVPWSNLAEMYPSFRPDAIEALLSQMEMTAADRATLINMRIDPLLLDVVVDFLYSPVHTTSVPPMIQLTSPLEAHAVTRETVAALLDGATPLHCATIRGSPLQIEHLVLHGADMHATTTAGEYPIELIPVCSNSSAVGVMCQCMGPHDQQVWTCSSAEARKKLCRLSLGNFNNGILAWLHMCLLVLLCTLNLWGMHTSLDRPALDKHMRRRNNANRQAFRMRAQSLLEAMRKDAGAGVMHLTNAQQTLAQGGTRAAAEVDGDELSGVALPLSVGDNAEHAFERFLHAIHSLQALELRGGTLPHGFLGYELHLEPSMHVPESEQATLYCNWALSVLLKYRTCLCETCESLAEQSIGMAHRQISTLFAAVEQAKVIQPQQWDCVGQCMEWVSLSTAGLTASLSPAEQAQVHVLEAWTRRADSDLHLAEALMGAPLMPTQMLNHVVSAAVVYDMDGSAFLVRTVEPETPGQLELALKLAMHASPHIKQLIHEVATNAHGELAAAAKLHAVLNVKQSGASISQITEQLHQAVAVASRYPHLEGEVHEALALRERLIKRQRAVVQLEEVLQRVQQPPRCGLQHGSLEERAAFAVEWQEKLDMLHAATEDARNQGVSVNKAKRLAKDLEAQAAAVDMGARLDEVLANAPCGSVALKTVLSKAEDIAAATAVNSSGITLGSEFLAPRLQAVKRQLELERAAEVLARCAQSVRSIESLPKLEAAILAARRVGADELDPEAYRLANDVRSRLDEAARHRQQLEGAVRALQRNQKREDADVVEQLISGCTAWGDLLVNDAAKASAAVEQWQAISAATTKLDRTLREGATAHQLSRTIQEASSFGVQVGHAKKMLKLIQSLEAAAASASDGALQPLALKTRIEAAEQGGCPEAVLVGPKQLLARLQITEAHQMLDAALKLRSAHSSMQRTAALQTALAKASTLLEQGWDKNIDMGKEVDSVEGESHAVRQPTSVHTTSDLLLSLQDLAMRAKRDLLVAHQERERVEAERQEEQRMRKERLVKEKEQQEAQNRERALREKQERERTAKERAARLEKERQVQEVLDALTDHSSYAAVKAQRERERVVREKEAVKDASIPVRRAVPIHRMHIAEGGALQTVASNASEAAHSMDAHDNLSVVSSVSVPVVSAQLDSAPLVSTPPASHHVQDVFLQGLPTEGLLQELTSESTFNPTAAGLFGDHTTFPSAEGPLPSTLWDPADVLAAPATNDRTLPLGGETGHFADLGGVSWGLGATPAEGMWYEQPLARHDDPLLGGGASLKALGFVTREEPASEWGAVSNTTMMPADMPIPAVVKPPRGRTAALCPEYQRGFCRLGSACVLTHDNVAASSGALPPATHTTYSTFPDTTT